MPRLPCITLGRLVLRLNCLSDVFSFHYPSSSLYILRALFFFFFNDTATTEIYTLSLHDALPISCPNRSSRGQPPRQRRRSPPASWRWRPPAPGRTARSRRGRRRG